MPLTCFALLTNFTNNVIVEGLMSSEEGIDAKTCDYLEGSCELMRLLSATGKMDKSPIMKLREDKNKRAFFFFAQEFLPFVVECLYF